MYGADIDGLLKKVANGDNAAFEKLYLQTKRGVFAFLYTYFHNYSDTEDAMQTVYLKIKKGIGTYNKGVNGRAWILQIAKNHALNELKRKKEHVPLDSLENIAVDSASNSSGVMEVMKAVLTEEEQRIVTLHVLWNYKHKEIANSLGCPVGTVTSKYKRAIEKLKKSLKEIE